MADGEARPWTGEAGALFLSGKRCGSCGTTLFPPQSYGCPLCGAPGELLTDASIPAEGRLHSLAVVNFHQGYPTPFTIAEVELDAGPLVRALLEGSPDLPHIGDRVSGDVVDGGLVFRAAAGAGN